MMGGCSSSGTVPFLPVDIEDSTGLDHTVLGGRVRLVASRAGTPREGRGRIEG